MNKNIEELQRFSNKLRFIIDELAEDLHNFMVQTGMSRWSLKNSFAALKTGMKLQSFLSV
jgi:hypothetical protein